MKRRREIFTGMGIEFRLNTEIGKDVTIDELLAEYDAVFMGMGTYTYMKGGFPGEDLDGVYDALDFLISNVNRCQGWEKDPSEYISMDGKKVIVQFDAFGKYNKLFALFSPLVARDTQSFLLQYNRC